MRRTRPSIRRGYHRGDFLRGESPTCECGASRVRPDGTFAPACPRCTLLDGSALSPAARALISELRQLGRATWDALKHELPEYEQRQLARAISALRRIGRVRRITIERADIVRPDFRRGWATRKDTSATSRDTTLSVVAAFELVEPSSK